MRLAREIWQILTPPQRRGVVAMQLVSLVMAFSTVSGIAAIAPFFAVLAEPELIERNTLLNWLYVHGGFGSERTFVVALGVGFIGVVLTANLINVLGMLAMHRLLLRIGSDLRTTLFGEYLSRPYAFHAATNSTILFNNIIYETTRVTYGLLQHAFVLVTNLVTAAFIVLSILLLRPIVAVVMVAGLAGGYLLIYLLMRKRLSSVGQTQSRFAREEAQIVKEGLGGIREIITLQAQAFFLGRSGHAGHGFLRSVAHSQRVAQAPRYIMECVAAAGLVGLALALSGREGGIGPWLGSLTFLGFAAYRLLPTLQQAFAAIVRVRADRGSLALIAADLRRARATLSALPPVDRTGVHAALSERPQRAIELKNVWYRYGPDRSWALREVSLQIPCRATVGIVGANGSGKSTLMDLVAGLLTPTAGEVEIDGCTLDDGNRAAWLTRIAYVPQEIFLFDASIAENIAVGVAADAIDERRLRDAARLAQLEEFVTTLPHGYRQRIGELGVAVSGGQRQRIGIARALYKNAPVLLLDEATNALDGSTEQELVTTLGRLRGRYTMLLIAHRMSTVRACDLIFHLDDGTIVGSGTYEGLRQSSDGFRRMTGLH